MKSELQCRRDKTEKHLQELTGAVHSQGTKLDQNLAQVQKEQARVTNIAKAPHVLIKDIDAQFEKATKLQKKDIAFLFGAAAVQTLRWVLLPALDLDFQTLSPSERMTSIDGGKLEKEGVDKYLKEEGLSKKEIAALKQKTHINNYTWEKLLIAPVPYDAMKGSARIVLSGISEEGKNLCGKNHHVATWGHDPIMGWVIGPLNITARMITFRDFRTYHVAQIENSFDQYITYQSSTGRMIQKSMGSWADDHKRFFVSVAKQRLHFQSDKYTKFGLPIPLLDAVTAQHLLENGWNSYEVERLFEKVAQNLGVIGTQFILAFLIDNVVKALHLLCYDASEDGIISLYTARTQKIVTYSNLLAEVGNGIYAATTGDVGKIDIGGYLNLARNIITNAKLQSEMKKDFLKNELYKQVVGPQYDFMEGL